MAKKVAKKTAKKTKTNKPSKAQRIQKRIARLEGRNKIALEKVKLREQKIKDLKSRLASAK